MYSVHLGSEVDYNGACDDNGGQFCNQAVTETAWYVSSGPAVSCETLQHLAGYTEQ